MMTESRKGNVMRRPRERRRPKETRKTRNSERLRPDDSRASGGAGREARKKHFIRRSKRGASEEPSPGNPFSGRDGKKERRFELNHTSQRNDLSGQRLIDYSLSIEEARRPHVPYDHLLRAGDRGRANGLACQEGEARKSVL